MKEMYDEEMKKNNVLIQKFESLPDEIKPIVAEWLLQQHEFYTDPNHWIKLEANKKGDKKYMKFVLGNINDLVKLIHKQTHTKLSKEQLKEISVLYQWTVFPYLEDVKVASDVVVKYYEKEINRDPFVLAAAREIEISKRINADGTYNTIYTSRDADVKYIIGSDGKPITTVTGDNKILAEQAEALYRAGYNQNFVHNVVFEDSLKDFVKIGCKYVKAVTEPVTMQFIQEIDMVKEIK